MDMQCQYRSKRCPNVRSLKISGELHRFCIFHRWRANATQRRWVQRKQTGDTEVSEGDEQSNSPKRSHHEVVDTPRIKMERDPEQQPAPKRRRSDPLTASKRASRAKQQSTAMAHASDVPSPARSPRSEAYIPPLPLCARVDILGVAMPSTFPALSDEDLAIFRHLVLETDDLVLREAKYVMPSSPDVGHLWWDVHYREKAEDVHAYLV